jgi:hypothetical protein
MCYLISPFSASVYAVIEGPVLAEGDQCVTVILGSVFSILAILCFCILLFIMRKKLVKCLHYAPVRPRSYPLVSGKFDALNNIFHCFQKVFSLLNKRDRECAILNCSHWSVLTVPKLGFNVPIIYSYRLSFQQDCLLQWLIRCL